MRLPSLTTYNVVATNKLTAICILLLTIALTSCASRPEATAIEKFAKAMEVTTAGMQTSFAKVEEASYTADLTKRSANFLASTKVQEPPIPPLMRKDVVIDAEDLRARLDVFEGLATYAKLLGVLSSGELEKAVDAGFSSAGTQLLGLGQQFATLANREPEQAKAWGNQLQAGVNAFSGLGSLLVQWRALTAVREAVTKAHPHIKQIAEFMTHDLGQPDQADRAGKVIAYGEGLRAILQRKVAEIKGAQENLLVQFRADASKIGLVKLHELFLQAEAKQEEWRRADAVLAAVQSALPKMVSAHEKLTASDARETVGLVGDFVAQAQKIAAAAERLTKQ